MGSISDHAAKNGVLLLKRKARILKAALLIMALVLTFLDVRGPPLAYADGASTTEELWIEWRISTNQGYSGTAGNGITFQDYTHLVKFNTTDEWGTIDYDDLEIYWMRAYIYSTGSDERLVRFAAYEYVGDTNAGSRLGYSEQMMDETPTGYQWRSATLDTYVSIGTATEFFFGMWSDSEGGSWLFSKGPESVAGNHIYDDDFSDPFSEAGNYAWARPLQFRAYGYKNTTTTHNQYYGNSTHYTARRDINYTFPSGANTRQMRITYPNSEAMLNVTYSNGGAFNAALSSSDYTTDALNSTHTVLTIPEATISTYGADYRVFTNSYSYFYSFNGGYYENGTNYGAFNLTVHFAGTTQQIEVDGTTDQGFATEPERFSWDMGSYRRQIYPKDSHETFYFFFPEDTEDIYTFEIRDFTGQVAKYTAWLESWRTANATEYLIERNLIQDWNPPLILVDYQTYELKIVLDDTDETEYSFGLYTSGIDPSPIVLNIRALAFSQLAQITYRHLTVEATRPSATQITVNYNDSRAETNSLTLTILYRNLTQAYYSYVEDEDNYQFNWLSANRYQDYVVRLVIDNNFYGTKTYEDILGVQRIYDEFPNLEALGTFGMFDTSKMFGGAFIIIMFLAGSLVNAEVTLFVGLIFAGMFVAWGILDISYSIIAVLIGLAIMFALIRSG